LDAAHRLGLVHRNVKPSNVLVADDGHVYLGDFEIVGTASDQIDPTGTEELLETLGYVSPEQIRGEHVDARADVYALGALLAFALSGRVPFDREGHAARLYADPPAPSRARPDVPKDLDAIIRRAMAKHPDDRFQTALALQGALAAIGARSQPLVRSAPAARASPSTPSRTPPPARARRVSPGPKARESVGDGYPIRPLTARRVALPSPPHSGPSGPPRGLRAPHARSQRRRRRTWRGLVAAMALVLALVSGFVLLDEAREQKPEQETVVVRSSTRDVAVVAGRVWVAGGQSPRVVGVSARDLQAPRREIDVGASVTALAARPDRLVVLAGRSLVTLQGADSRRSRRLVLPMTGSHVVSGSTAAWVASSDNRVLLRIAGDVARRIVLSSRTSDLALGPRALLVAHADEGTVSSIDARTGALRREHRVGGRPEALAATEDAVWIADTARDAVLRLNPDNGRTDALIPVGGNPVALAADEREVWVARRNDDAVMRIDARTSRPLDEVKTAHEPVSITLTRDGAWIGGLGGELTRVPRAAR